MATQRQLERLRYSPHFEYVKDLVLSEGIQEQLPSWMEERIAHSPSAVVSQLRDNKRRLSETLDGLRQRLRPVEGFAEYDAWLSQDMPDEADVDWEALEDGPHRADVLLFRTLLQLHQATELTEGVLVQLGGEPDVAKEQADIRRWVAQEKEKRRLQGDIRSLRSRLVDGLSTDFDRQYAEATTRLSAIEHEQRVRERRLVDNMAIAFAPGARAVHEEIPRIQELARDGLIYRMKGDPAPLLNTLLAVLFEKQPLLSSVVQGIKALRRAMEMAANVRSLMAQQAVRLATSAFIQPARKLLRSIADQVSGAQREIFWPIFDILEVLSGNTDFSDESTAELNELAQSLVSFLEALDQGVTELVKEARRFDRSLTQGIKESLAEIQLLKQLEGYGEMFEQLLLQVENLPIDLSKKTERQRLVDSLIESQGWRRAQTPTDEEGPADSVDS